MSRHSSPENSAEPPSKKLKPTESTIEPINSSDEIYLDTIDRKRLDFDFEKICHITLSTNNIYGCLICGKYLQGRSPSSAAFNHTILESHHVFINFTNLKVYVLPENYEVKGKGLDDIKYQVLPTYNEQDVSKLHKGDAKGRDLNGVDYIPGYIGLNNMKANDYENVIIQALSHVSSVRDVLLVSGVEKFKNELCKRFVILVKKLWSSLLFKSHVSPHEFLQYVSVLSNKKFAIGEQKDPKDFLVWSLNALSKGFKEDGEGVINKSFQGKIQILSKPKNAESFKEINTKFWLLTLELPSVPVLKDTKTTRQIQQVKLSQLLDIYEKGQEVLLANGEVRKYKILKSPRYLILHFNRFKDKNLDIDLSLKDRNQTMVDFPLEYEFLGIKYKLISNVVHEVIESNTGDEVAEKSNWKVQLRYLQEWFEIENLIVKPKEKEFLFLNETYIQIWERI